MPVNLRMAKLDSCGPTYKIQFNLKFQKRSCQTPGMLVVHDCNGRTPIMVCDLLCIFSLSLESYTHCFAPISDPQTLPGKGQHPALLLMSPVTDGEQTEKCTPIPCVDENPETPRREVACPESHLLASHPCTSNLVSALCRFGKILIK